ncbi:protein-glutamate methylesterase/protein-glutamine glutaminase [Helicovermis profundi]|uniref:Protein-glutamate methylesterase/protein-glutamine glutaminase n=1 Tax=Helicovermis profundi TaxID=3065157 RepID=A0AAU9E8B5_9FIRM|nr:chemotaxis response regulator protein-glutamate methylesterase [Clostridia bacterium S502]
MKKIRVLIVDDSILIRGVLSRNLVLSNKIEVVGTARDAFDARDKILKLKPDVLTLDVQMPRMNGIDFLRLLMPQHPMPVVVVSSLSESVFDAMEAGAVDFVEKPSEKDNRSQKYFINELVEKILIASTSNIKKSTKSIKLIEKKVVKENSIDLIAIGASTGGTEALSYLLSNLFLPLPPIVIVQHMPVKFTKLFAERLNRESNFTVKEAENGEPLKSGHVYLAKGDNHIIVEKIGNKGIVKIKKTDKVNGHKPSVDVLFNSVAESFGSNSLGIILTGMGKDGARGLLEMKKKHAITIGQNSGSCVVYGMPKSAYRIGAIDYELHLTNIPEKIENIIRQKIELDKKSKPK